MLLFVWIFLGIFIIFIFRKKIRKLKNERKIAMIIAGFAFLWEVGLYVWKIAHGATEWDEFLPIGLCAFTLFIGIIALFFKKFSLFEIGYFWTWGALASILFPDILFSYDRYRFYQFMIGHSFFFFMYIYMIFIYRWYPTWKSWRKSVITLVIVTIILIIISNITNKNLMFMLNSEGSPFGMFEGNGYLLYLVGVILMSFAICTIWYLPFFIYNKKNIVKIK
jgi:hypothetical integral membrane protein (TIGR02206 family)